MRFVAEAMVAESGGTANGVQRETVSQGDAQARRVETWIKKLVVERRAAEEEARGGQL